MQNLRTYTGKSWTKLLLNAVGNEANQDVLNDVGNARIRQREVAAKFAADNGPDAVPNV